jgi:hypothetical protein
MYEEQARNPTPEMIRLRQIKAERQQTENQLPESRAA